MPVMAQSGEMLTLVEASERFGVAVPTLRFWRSNGVLTKYRRGDGKVVVDAAEVVRRLDERQQIRREE